ncbi:MAG: S8 family serine peptidase, partial [Thermodesulfovibrionales bacterium]|nr:S8 family serine peptidase [Thermodesulfovibrionales bacterium]
DDDKNGYIDDCYGWDFVGNDNNPIDDYGHGTHVSGVIGAVSNNGLKIAGILWDVRIMALKFLGANGGGDVAGAVSALNYAVKMGAKVVNASYGSSMYSQTEYDSIASANQKGVLFIAAAGNDAENNDIAPSYPCSYGLPNIISVAASDMNDNIASFSNFGPSKVDVAAPGVYVLSLIPNNGSGMNQDFWPGTSMATPYVVGLAGLVMTQPEYAKMNFSIYQVRAIIESYVDSLPAFAKKIKTGGRINAYKSVTALLGPTNLQTDAFGPTSTERLRVHLNWKNNATGVDNIRVERMILGKDTDFKEIAQLSPNVSSYTDFDVSGDTIYRYRVRAFKSFTQSYVPLSERNIYTFYTIQSEIKTPTDTGYSAGSGGCSVVRSFASKSKIGNFDIILLTIPIFIIIFAVIRKNKKQDNC